MFPFAIVIGAIIAAAIVIDSPGSPLFIQERVGKDGRLFRMYKFRTMPIRRDNTSERQFMKAYIRGQINEETLKIYSFKPPNPILTRIGRLLRKSSLDELPQIINILKGEMSLIGPRPNVTFEVEEYSLWHHQRHKVLPGITGLAQVNGRSEISFDDLVHYDILYVRDVSLKLDISILLKTVWVVFSGKGAG
jgi:lipopolysaccharide/colanic/teichoic acid biosynthesis glycosyltransferase